MKKILAMVLALVMVMAMAGCNNNGGNETTPPTTTEATVVGPDSTLALMEAVWGNYGDDEKFAVIGGNIENAVDNAPGNYDMQYAENLTGTLLIPADQLANVTEAATMVHMMNANTFTGGAVKLAEGADAAAFAAAVRDAIQNNQWMCGFPEKLVVATLGDYIVIAYGHSDAMNPFQQHLCEAYADVVLTYDEAIG